MLRRVAAPIAVGSILLFLLASPAAADGPRRTQESLRNATAASLTYFTADDSFSGLDPTTAEAIEPELDWLSKTRPVGPAVVDLEIVRDQKLLLIAQTSGGRFFTTCARMSKTDWDIKYGRANNYRRASRLDECRLESWS